MQKQIPILCYILLSLTSSLISQENMPRKYHWSLGVSSGDILHELFGDSDDSKTYAAFVVEYAGEKYAVQAGIRPSYNKADTHHDGFLDTEIDDALAISGHVSVTRTIFADAKWLIRAGVGYHGGWSREDITKDSGFDRVITRRLQWNGGLGPVADVRFFVHPRISLGTDAGLFFSFGRSELQQLFTNFPDFNNTKDTVETTSLEVNEPATIYIRFHF